MMFGRMPATFWPYKYPLTPHPFHPILAPQPLSSPLGYLLAVCECFVRFCVFEASGVEVLAYLFCYIVILLDCCFVLLVVVVSLVML